MPSELNDIEKAKELALIYQKLKKEISKIIFGQDEIIEYLIIALFSNGHSLFVGVPGLAKTLLISTLAKTVDLDFKRIQFTPDLMPSDISGFELLQYNDETEKREFKFIKGPVFTNILLADEINRTPPKTQSALLQAMQEREVTIAGVNYKLDYPFLVFATQNPIEHEGTYLLPEAQQDRFMFNIQVNYPSLNDEVKIVQETTVGKKTDIKTILTPEDLVKYQNLITKVPVSEVVIKHAVNIVHLTRPETTKLDCVKDFVKWGAGPRASQNLVIAAKTKALLEGRHHVSVDDINYLAYSILNHRIIVNYRAKAEKIDANYIIDKILDYMRKNDE